MKRLNNSQQMEEENNDEFVHGKLIRVSSELISILETIRKNVDNLTWGAEPEISYMKASKILAARITKSGIY